MAASTFAAAGRTPLTRAAAAGGAFRAASSLQSPRLCSRIDSGAVWWRSRPTAAAAVPALGRGREWDVFTEGLGGLRLQQKFDYAMTTKQRELEDGYKFSWAQGAALSEEALGVAEPPSFNRTAEPRVYNDADNLRHLRSEYHNFRSLKI
jgi:hypothetical protein